LSVCTWGSIIKNCSPETEKTCAKNKNIRRPRPSERSEDYKYVVGDKRRGERLTGGQCLVEEHGVCSSAGDYDSKPDVKSQPPRVLLVLVCLSIVRDKNA
jgi:hypothetical protein